MPIKTLRDYYGSAAQQKQKGLLAFRFDLQTDADLETMGCAFAPVVMSIAAKRRDSEIPRVALVGGTGAGKSTFLRKLLSSFPEKTLVEAAPAFGKEQNIWNCRGALLRHFDVSCLKTFQSKPGEGMAVDLVENANADRKGVCNNLTAPSPVECLIEVSRKGWLPWFNKNSPRKISITAPEDICSSPAFQNFLKDAAALQADL